jgi:hypothetical protein
VKILELYERFRIRIALKKCIASSSFTRGGPEVKMPCGSYLLKCSAETISSLLADNISKSHESSQNSSILLKFTSRKYVVEFSRKTVHTKFVKLSSHT